MIAFTATTDPSAMTLDAVSLPANSTTELITSLPARDIEIDSGVGVFQSFELARPLLQQRILPDESAEKEGIGETSSTEGTSNSEESMAATKSVRWHVLGASDICTIVVMSTVTTIVGGRRHKEEETRQLHKEFGLGRLRPW
ncbi:MAG: hypothetical protein JXM70_07755 [Pirellulales bacterium]|nr:hypothetical protein [Pirellulales bacterium]